MLSAVTGAGVGALIDTHCHLDAAEFDDDRAAVIEAAQAAGVVTLIVPAIERANFGAVAAVCREFPACRPAWGIHPMFVGRADEGDLEALRNMLRDNPWQAVAVGEIGLDGFVEGVDFDRQTVFFIEQLKIAAEFDLPVILHVRRAVDDVLKQLRHYRVRGGIAHAFNGSRQQADEFVKLGFCLGFGGAMTFTRALRIRELAATLPLEAIVLETDAPDIPPTWLAGQRNAPRHLPGIAATLSELRGLSFEQVAEATTANAHRVLKLV
jgi:TatD DNase family protein